jgi:catechol 2,3-dioxygenase-like lactoylglutathione lyase family enzyme
MAIRLDHTIIPARNGEAAARWFAEVFGGSEPVRFSVFWQVTTANGVDLDFDTYGADGTFTTGHYAFLVDEDEFDAIFDRIRASAVDYWADPGRLEVGAINRHDGGRGVYFPSPDDHLFEIITVPYGGVAKPD